MKKLITFILTLCCLTSLFLIPASATNNVPSVEINGEFVQIEGRDTLTPVKTPATETQEPTTQPRLSVTTTVDPEYVLVFPLVYYNGEFLIPDMGYRFGPTPGVGNIVGLLSRANQEALKDYVRSLGYEPIGWYIEGSYYINSYKPDRLTYYSITHAGKSEVTSTRATNGSTSFSVMTLYPQNPNIYNRFGIKGTVSFYNYHPSLTGNPLYPGEFEIGLEVEFAPN